MTYKLELKITLLVQYLEPILRINTIVQVIGLGGTKCNLGDKCLVSICFGLSDNRNHTVATYIYLLLSQRSGDNAQVKYINRAQTKQNPTYFP